MNNFKLILQILIILLFLLGFILIPLDKVLTADIYILPSTKELNVGNNLEMVVYVDSIDQAINAVSFKISYPEDLLEFISFSKSGTIISLWVQEPKGGEGEILAEGIILNPGFTGSKGKILSITFKTLKTGIADLKFVSGSILANDGLGTNILKNMNGGNFIIREKVTKKPIESVIEESVQEPVFSYLPAPKIFSPTHYNQEKWYNDNDPVFEWELPEGVTEVRLVYSKDINAIPTVAYSPPISKRKLNDLSDGSYYFNVQFIGKNIKSQITRYKFKIDTTRPKFEEFSMNLIDFNSFKIKVKGLDETSGIDKIEVYLNNNLFKSVNFDSFEEIITNLNLGKHLINVKIFDKAGNFIEKSEIVNIIQEAKEPELVIVKDYTLYFLILFILILLIIIILIIYFTKHKVEVIHKEIRKEKISQIGLNLHQQIKNTLLDLKHNISLLDEDPSLSQTEKGLYKQVKDILEEAENKINEKLKDLK